MHLASLLALATVAASSNAASWSDVNREANQAIKASDYTRLKAALLQLRPLMPGNPRNMYNLAATYARLGETGAAIEELRNLAATGLVYDLKADEDFNLLAGVSGLSDVLAKIETNQRPVTHARLHATFAEDDLLPESIVYDRAFKRFLISSVRKSKIITADGRLFASAD